jgi:hypothetical protein
MSLYGNRPVSIVSAGNTALHLACRPGAASTVNLLVINDGAVFMKYVLVPLAAFVVSASAAVIAADAPPRSGRLAECRPDVEKLCQGVEPGHGRIASCLRQNESQVSAACKEALAKARDRRPPQASPPQG